MGDEVDFLPADKQKTFLQVDVCKARHAQSTQNNKFSISFKYLKENVKHEVDFLPADKHEKFLQIDTIILGLCCPACTIYQK